MRELIDLLDGAGALTKKVRVDTNGDGDGNGGGVVEEEEKALTYVIGSNDNYILSASTSTATTVIGDGNPAGDGATTTENATIATTTVAGFDAQHMLSSALSNPSTIFAGKPDNMQLLLDEITSQKGQEEDVILWTRLDADDGLFPDYLEYVQRQAIRYFLPWYYDLEMVEQEVELPGNGAAVAAGVGVGGEENLDAGTSGGDVGGIDNGEINSASSDAIIASNTKYQPPQWTFWCTGRNIDWFVTDPVRDPHHKNGTVYPIQKNNFCITPGITLAMRSGVDPESIPRLDHHRIASSLKSKGGGVCGRNGVLSLFKEDGKSAHEKEEVDDGS